MPENVIQLRGGYQTEDPRTDRLPHYDPESRKWKIRTLLEQQEVPLTMPTTGRTWPLLRKTRLDQLKEGACVGFTGAHDMQALPGRVPDVTNETARWIYKEAQKIDPWAGEAYEGTAVLAGLQILRRIGAIKEFRWGGAGSGDVFLDLTLALRHEGPGIAGLKWFSNCMNVDKNGYIHPTGSEVGGHAILIRGMSISKRYFILSNSWGLDWGIFGDCKVSFDEMGPWLEDDGEVAFGIGRSKTVNLLAA